MCGGGGGGGGAVIVCLVYCMFTDLTCVSGEGLHCG